LEQKKPIILFGAGQTGKEARDHYGVKNVHFFADNNKAGLYHCGIPVLSVEDLQRIRCDYEIIITTQPKFYDEIKRQLDNAGISAALYRPDDVEELFRRNPRLEKFKSIHKGRRCFLIGNGPSLRAEDLDKIHQNSDISFGSNKIYKIFEKTEWRPDYYFSGDPLLLAQNFDDILKIKENKFLVYTRGYTTPEMISKLSKMENIYMFESLFLNYDPQKNALLPTYLFFNESYPSFSEDAARFVYEGFTITYLMMQWAAYMGFSEIFLLGVDHNFKPTSNVFEQIIPPRIASGEIHENHFCNDYFKEGESIYVADLDSTGLAYEKAEQYSRQHGFRIYNATRGGDLEVFERIDFDSLF